MDKKNWEKIKKDLVNFHPTTRIKWLAKLLNMIKDKKIVSDIDEEIKKAEVEIQGQRLWKREGIFLRPGEADEDKEVVITPTETLEEAVETGVVDEGAEAVIDYGLSSFGEVTSEEAVSGEVERIESSYASKLNQEREQQDYVTTKERGENLIRSEEHLEETERYKRGGFTE